MLSQLQSGDKITPAGTEAVPQILRSISACMALGSEPLVGLAKSLIAQIRYEVFRQYPEPENNSNRIRAPCKT